MSKVDTELLKTVLQNNEVGPRKIAQILEDIGKELEAVAAEDGEKEPAIKKQYVMIVSDPNEILKGQELTGWIVQIPEESSVYTATEKLIASVHEFNTTKKGRRMPIETYGDACESLPAKIAKEQNLWIKTKGAVFVLPVDNAIPAPRRDRNS